MNTAVYAGTFDPVTLGHLSIIRQAARMCAHVVVLVAHNPAKQTLLSLEDRLVLLREGTAALPNVSVAGTQGLVVEYARSIGASILVRGLRGPEDAPFETSLAQANRQLAPEITTLLIPADPELMEVSSTRVRERLQRGEDISTLCPPVVANRLQSKVTRS